MTRIAMIGIAPAMVVAALGAAAVDDGLGPSKSETQTQRLKDAARQEREAWPEQPESRQVRRARERRERKAKP
jgi:hypothetical protein